MISTHVWHKISHLTLIALPHYRVKCDQVKLVKTNVVPVIFS